MRTILAVITAVLAMMGVAHAQTWQCFSGAVACAPGSPNCNCTQVPQPPPMAMAPAVPTCPVMTFWNGITCQVPAAPAVDTSFYQQQLLQQQLLQQQMQQERMQEWQREQWRSQHPQGPGGDHH
jgi:hypothetical protein